ncbi:phage minor head protein [Eubacterium ramulus]
MTKEQKAVLQNQLNSEKRTLNELKQVYRRALMDCEKKIMELSARTDLENLQSIIYQTRYQEVIRQQMEGILAALQSDSYSTVSDYLSRCYQDGYIGVMYDLHGQDIPLIMPIDQKAVVRAIQTDSKISKGLYNRLGEDVGKLKTSIRAEVSRGIAAGFTWNEVATRLAKSFKTTEFSKAYNNAMRIVRTEGHRIQVQSAMDAQQVAKAHGADIVKQWDSTLDDRTRETHRMLDGQIRELDEPFEVGGLQADAPGMFGIAAQDCNCRCALLQRARWALNEDELNTLKERAEFFGLDKTKDFEEFKEKYLKAEEKLENIDKRSMILSTKEVINKAKELGNAILQGEEKLTFDNGNPIYDYVAKKLNYDALPKIVDSSGFIELEKDSPVGIIYRGIVADTQEKAKHYANDFMYGKMYAGKSYAYGSGTYFSPDKKEAELYNNQGIMLKSLLSKDAKVVKYKDIVKEYSGTGADIAKMKKGDNTEAWEDILRSVGEFAAIKGYDAIDMAGAMNKKHVIVLNRGKVIIENEGR